MPSYILSEPYKQRIDHALSVVEGQPSQGNVTTIPTRFETLPQPPSKTFRICTFTGSWSIGASKEVTFRGVTTTVSAVNLFFPISSGPSSDTDCAIAKDGTAWYLIDVPFEKATAVFAASTSSQSLVTDVSISAVLNTSNCGITVGKTLTTAAVTIVASTFTSTFLRFKGGA